MKKPNTVYVIDDDKIYTYLLSRQIKSVDFCDNTLIFNNGQEAINHLSPLQDSHDELPDVILLDLNMPVMDGWQFLDVFDTFKLAKKIKVYIVSSSIDEADHQKAAGYDICNFYVKPISKENLAEIKRDILS
ncbi:response regulator [Pedobacter sp. GR22-6]|uniref:response regulator n=1 Tax=Pedobacter sp. GR22-6 TaxID=3127957 RepID=UPI00307CE7F6